MDSIRQNFEVSFSYRVHFIEDVFDPHVRTLIDVIESAPDPSPRSVLTVVDGGLLRHDPSLIDRIHDYFREFSTVEQAAAPVIVPGGEAAKNDPDLVIGLHEALHAARLCRHSYLMVVGGGSVIDLAGYVAATAHRGVRLIRIPTTVLSQNDSGIGVKNGINRFGTKNFLGTFAPPYAVINASTFLETLEDRDWRSGISEAVKVALLKDASFFDALEADAGRLSPAWRDMEAMRRLIHRCAALHLDHIATSGDPFETGTSRPLDFGHWAAHRLEQLTDYELRHGEAVAIGIALDTTYSYLQGLLDETSWRRTIELFEAVGLEVYAPELDEYAEDDEHPRCIFHGLEAFREHLGGDLTIMLLERIGSGIEVHEVDLSTYRSAIAVLRDRHPAARNVA